MSTSGKVTDWVKPGDSSGEFKRQVSAFRESISNEPGAKFPVEKGRYHLYISYACPWVRLFLRFFSFLFFCFPRFTRTTGAGRMANVDIVLTPLSRQRGLSSPGS